MSTTKQQPESLGEYRVPDDRETVIKAHIANLSATARQVSDELAFSADVSDVIGVLESSADDAGEGAR